MNIPHPLGILSSKEAVEAVDPKFVMEGLKRARQKTILVMHEIRHAMKVGMTEDEARKLCLEIFSGHGVKKHWHKPNVRFGPGTTLNFNDPLQPDYKVKDGDAFYVDLGPVWSDPELELEYEGDYGDTFALGTNPEAEKCAAAARTLFVEAQREWKEKKITGAGIYSFLKTRSSELGYVLVEDVNGHRLSDFPHHKHSKNTLSEVSFNPSDSLWVLEIQMNHPTKKLGAFFEDLL